MAKGNRTKPCSNCKKAKVKCEYENSLPCVRCLKYGTAHSCHFLIKLPTLNFPVISNPQLDASMDKSFETPRAPVQNGSRPLNSIYNVGNTLPAPIPARNAGQNAIPTTLPSLAPSNVPPKTTHVPLHPKTAEKDSTNMGTNESEWRSSMENKLNSVDAKFNDILSALQANQNTPSGTVSPAGINQDSNNREKLHNTGKTGHAQNTLCSKRRGSVSVESNTLKRARYGPDDFRDNVITIDDAKTLFKFFDENIAQQLFGFEIKKFAVDVVWESSPILVCAICTIASMHYPHPDISTKQSLLQEHLRKLCASVLFTSRPRTEQEAFNTIVSLVLCSFWLSDSQMFTGLALQLAKEFNLNRPAHGEQSKSSLNEQDRLKLWYLLFILDGQQSMTLNRQALVSSDDYTLQNPRQSLLQEESLKIKDKNHTARKNSVPKIVHEPRHNSYEKMTDLRLVSQVEYNIALSESFKGNAWDLLAPQSFGIPSRTNLELDKWMVSWTVLLAPMNNGTVWSSKSTLIYYNFAKMHINSSVIRQLQEDRAGESLLLPNWRKYKTPVQDTHAGHVTEASEFDSDDSDSDEEDDFVTNAALVTQDQALVSYNIAVNAAQTVLNLVLSDPDISNNLKYVPVHIHMMLYYAAILLVSPPALARDSDLETARYFHDVIDKLKIVRCLQKKVYLNLPTDRSFGDQLIRNLENLFEERIATLMAELHESRLDIPRKAELINEISTLQFTSTVQSSLDNTSNSSSRESSPRPEKISAWPGSHHGHP
ncbi:hypothetical protein OXX79_005752 [Metschnikowia pulcherrima]